MAVVHVPGKKAGRIMMYTLSTCVWCKKTKQFLKDLGVEYDYLDVDQLSPPEREKAMDMIRQWNPAGSFPTMVVNDSRCIVGFQEEEIRGALKL
ncbi:MAG: glutaredoxin family protein [Chloroflexota bacterium]